MNKSLKALERIKYKLSSTKANGYWEDLDIIETTLKALDELKQMEQELDCSFKDIYHALKAGCVIEFNGKEAIAHARGNKL